jgi:hypothetical protein
MIVQVVAVAEQVPLALMERRLTPVVVVMEFLSLVL